MKRNRIEQRRLKKCVGERYKGDPIFENELEREAVKDIFDKVFVMSKPSIEAELKPSIFSKLKNFLFPLMGNKKVAKVKEQSKNGL